MNILLISDNFYPEGNAIASRLYERASYWVKWGHHVTVITSAPNFPEGKLYPGYQNRWYQRETLQDIHIIRIKTFIRSNKGFFLRILDFLSFMMPAFIAGLLQKKPDLIMTTSPQFFGALSACMVATCKRIPFVLEIGDIWSASIVGVGAMRASRMIRILEKMEMFLYNHSHTIIVVSPAFKEDLMAKGIASQKIAVILNGVEQSKYMPIPRDVSLAQQYGIQEQTFVVGYIGTHGMAHALENVLKAAAVLLQTAHHHIKFIFVGTGAERDLLIAKAQTMHLTNIQFVPPQSKEIIHHFWSICNIALVHFRDSLTLRGSIPSKIFEAMGMGLPIVLAAPKGSARDIILNEKVGLWVPPEDPTALASAILHLYHHPALLHQLAEASRIAASCHTRETQARKCLLTFASLLPPVNVTPLAG